MLDPKSQEMLNTILGKDKAVLSDEEKGFLIGRRGYLNEEQYARYADIFAGPDGKPVKKAKVEAEEASTEEETGEVTEEEVKPKKGKK